MKKKHKGCCSGGLIRPSRVKVCRHLPLKFSRVYGATVGLFMWICLFKVFCWSVKNCRKIYYRTINELELTLNIYIVFVFFFQAIFENLEMCLKATTALIRHCPTPRPIVVAHSTILSPPPEALLPPRTAILCCSDSAEWQHNTSIRVSAI